MQQPVDIPLHKIPHHKKRHQLGPDRPGIQMNGYKISNTKKPQKIIKQINNYVRGGIVNDERKQEEIEEHVEEIQPKIPSELRLI